MHATHLKKHDNFSVIFLTCATISADSLHCYCCDEDGEAVYDVIGSRCDPCTNAQLNQMKYDFCCHSNLTRAVVRFVISEEKIYSVLNVPWV